MLLQWRASFINNGQSPHNSSMEVIQTYIVHLQNQTDTHQKKTRDTNTNQQLTREPQGYHSSQKNKLSTSSLSSNAIGKSGRKHKLSNDDNCQIHIGVHKWGQYHQN